MEEEAFLRSIQEPPEQKQAGQPRPRTSWHLKPRRNLKIKLRSPEWLMAAPQTHLFPRQRWLCS